MKIVLTEDRERELRSRVMRGVEALDTVSSDWWTYINLEVLNLRSCQHCVLGQLYGSYMTGVSALTEQLREVGAAEADLLDPENGRRIHAPLFGFDHDADLQYTWVEEDDLLDEGSPLDPDLSFVDCHLGLMGVWWADIIAERQSLGAA